MHGAALFADSCTATDFLPLCSNGEDQITMPKQDRRAQLNQDAAFAAYMRDVSRHALLTPAQERELGAELVDRRTRYYKEVLSYPPYTAAALQVITEQLDDDATEALREDFSRAAKMARRTRDSNRKAAAEGFEQAVDELSKALALADPECVGADRVAADLELLASRETRGVSMNVRPPRRGSRPYVDYLARVRRSAAALRVVRNKFARANLRLVVRIAGRFQRAGLTLHDRVQEGNLGLMKAIDRFDPTKGFRFSTYASWWIKHAIRRAVVNRDRVVRLPAHLQATASKIGQARARLRGKLEREPTAADLARELDLPLDKVEQTLEAMGQRPVSLDAPLGGEDDRTVADLLTDPEELSLPERFALEEDAIRVRGTLLELAPMEQDILRQRFGLDGTQPRTLTEIGEQYSLSRERIRQLQQKALSRLRTHLEEPPRRPRSAPAQAVHA